ncbi:MAG: HEAT repeat domain-containing protein, partial [Planctomycetota bacterium]
ASEALAGLFDQLEVALASAAAAALEHAGEPAAAPAIFEHLASYDPPDARALGALVRLGGRKGLRFALEQWRSGRWAGKYFALHAMRYSPPAVAGEPDEAVRALIEAWRDPESPYQGVAARSLVALGQRSGPAVAALLRSDSADARRRAAELLGRIGGRLAVRALVAAIDRTTTGADAGSSREAQALGFVADRALARTKGTKALLRLHSTPDERRAASARWKELSGL